MDIYSTNFLMQRAFLYVDSFGIPLPILIDECNKRHLLVDLERFKQDAIDHGWKPAKAEAIVAEALQEIRIA
jgi:hypothetical protein